MKNILLLTDFSDNSCNAIEYALSFYQKTVCNFHILHVSKINHFNTHENRHITGKEEIDEVFIKPVKEQLERLKKRIINHPTNNKNHKFYTLADYSLFIDSVRKHVKEKEIDMIVMGTKGASKLQQFILGSNAGNVITKVHCTTLVIPESVKYSTLKEIAFPTDFVLPYTPQVLQPIFEILEKENPSLRIVHINKEKSLLNIDQQNNKNLLEDLLENYNYSFHSLTSKKTEHAVQLFVESRDVNMIVMIAKNLNYFQQILFHSKVEKISYHTSIPFLVLHE